MSSINDTLKRAERLRLHFENMARIFAVAETHLRELAKKDEWTLDEEFTYAKLRDAVDSEAGRTPVRR